MPQHLGTNFILACWKRNEFKKVEIEREEERVRDKYDFSHETFLLCSSYVNSLPLGFNAKNVRLSIFVYIYMQIYIFYMYICLSVCPLMAASCI